MAATQVVVSQSGPPFKAEIATASNAKLVLATEVANTANTKLAVAVSGNLKHEFVESHEVWDIPAAPTPFSKNTTAFDAVSFANTVLNSVSFGYALLNGAQANSNEMEQKAALGPYLAYLEKLLQQQLDRNANMIDKIQIAITTARASLLDVVP